MKLPPFEYACPTTLNEAVALLASHDGEAKPLAGGQSLMPTASDFPSIRAVALEQRPSPLNPMGTKGAGEGGIIPVGGVVANAVAAALSSLGVKLHELPLTPPRVWEMIQTARQTRARGRP